MVSLPGEDVTIQTFLKASQDKRWWRENHTEHVPYFGKLDPDWIPTWKRIFAKTWQRSNKSDELALMKSSFKVECESTHAETTLSVRHHMKEVEYISHTDEEKKHKASQSQAFLSFCSSLPPGMLCNSSVAFTSTKKPLMHQAPLKLLSWSGNIFSNVTKLCDFMLEAFLKTDSTPD